MPKQLNLDEILEAYCPAVFDVLSPANDTITKDEAKQQITQMVKEIIGDTKGVNPSAKDFYEGYDLAQKEATDRARSMGVDI